MHLLVRGEQPTCPHLCQTPHRIHTGGGVLQTSCTADAGGACDGPFCCVWHCNERQNAAHSTAQPSHNTRHSTEQARGDGDWGCSHRREMQQCTSANSETRNGAVSGDPRCRSTGIRTKRFLFLLHFPPSSSSGHECDAMRPKYADLSLCLRSRCNRLAAAECDPHAVHHARCFPAYPSGQPLLACPPTPHPRWQPFNESVLDGMPSEKLPPARDAADHVWVGHPQSAAPHAPSCFVFAQLTSCALGAVQL